MSGYNIIRLSDIVTELGEEKALSILSDFSCPVNPDIENFLKSSAITLGKQRVSVTYLIFTSFKKQDVLIGYFTLCNKTIVLHKSKLSNNLSKKINKFATYDMDRKGYVLSAPLIAQIGKNFNNNYNSLISGDELLKIAIEKVSEGQKILGGKIVYLECEDIPFLIDFYSDNGFCEFDKRHLKTEEQCHLNTPYLVQMLKYLR